MDIVVNGPGEVLVCLIDHQGKALLQERLRISGSGGISARWPMSLSLETRNGHVAVSPVLASHGSKQHITFDGQEPAKFTEARCKEIGCSEAVVRAAGRGQVELLPAEPGHTPTRHLPGRPQVTEAGS